MPCTLRLGSPCPTLQLRTTLKLRGFSMTPTCGARCRTLGGCVTPHHPTGETLQGIFSGPVSML